MLSMTRHRPRLVSSISYPTVCLSLLLGFGPIAPFISHAQAQERSYNVPGSDLGAALSRFASQAGVSLSVDPALVSGRSTPGISGSYSVDEGFARLLQGSGLRLQAVGGRQRGLYPGTGQ